MFTNLDFLEVGNEFPPINDAFKARQDNFINGRLLYNGELEAVYQDVWDKIKTRYNNKSLEQVLVKVNLFRPLTETFKLLAFQNEPEIRVGEGENVKDIAEYYDERKAINLLKSAFISSHAQGTGVFKVYKRPDNEFDISLACPENWIPVYFYEDLNTVKCHVVSQIYEVDNETSFLGISRNNKVIRVYVEIHYKGYYDQRTLELATDGKTVAKVIARKDNIKTGLDDFAVFPFDYGVPTWESYGVSAYNDLIPIVEEIIARYSNQSAILDKHADPTITAPPEAFERDKETGEWVLPTGNAIQMSKDGAIPQYVTWDGNLTASFQQIQDMMNLYYMISGTNPQLFGQDIAGNLSGEALQKILIVPLAKTKEMLKSLEDAGEKAFNALLQLKGIKEKAYISFNAANFLSASELANNILQQKQGGLISTQSALEVIHPDWSDNDISDELVLLNEEEKKQSMIDLESIYPKDVNEQE